MEKKILINKYFNFNDWLLNPNENKIIFNKNDIKYLYWTAASIGGLIKSDKGSSQSLILMPQVGLLLNTSLSIDSSWGLGSIYTALISYTMSEFPISKDKFKTAEMYFDRAIQLSDSNTVSPYVTFAESVLIKKQKKDEFIKLLKKGISIKTNDNKDYELENYLAKNRAKWLLSRVDDLFY